MEMYSNFILFKFFPPIYLDVRPKRVSRTSKEAIWWKNGPKASNWSVVWALCGPIFFHLGCFLVQFWAVLGAIPWYFLDHVFGSILEAISFKFWSRFVSKRRLKNSKNHWEGGRFWCFSLFRSRLDFGVVLEPFGPQIYVQVGLKLGPKRTKNDNKTLNLKNVTRQFRKSKKGTQK